MIAPAQIPNPYVKPRWQAPVGVMESVVAYNCRKYGMPLPVMAVPMWEGAGNLTLDLSGNGNHAQFYNEAKWSGEGIDVDGTNDYLQSPHSSSIDFADEDFAVSMRFNTTTAKANNYLFSKNYGGVGVKWYGANLNTTGNRISFFVDDGANNSAVDTRDDFNDGEWHDLVCVRDTTANKVIVYIDGVLHNAWADISGSIANTGNLTIGGRSDLNVDRFFPGGLKLFTEYDTVPTAQQVKFMHDNPWFMYRMPEELYGYVAAAAGISIPSLMQQMNQFDGGTYALD